MPALPTPQQVAWQDREVGMFYHFDLPVFTDLKEGEWQQAGHLDPALFNPAKLDTDQWLEAARAIGATYTVFVAKHCSGFLSWQSDLYPYGVKQSPWRGGRGDMVADYVASCERYGIAPGLYASVVSNAHFGVSSPGLVNWGAGGDDAAQARYVRIVEGMLAELWGNYGPLFEVWFDGGALPVEQGGPDVVPLLHRLQPDAMVFQGPAATIRWIGNEQGVAGYPCWATVAESEDWGNGDPDGSVWQPGECDVPIRNHFWFWRPGLEHTLYTLDELVDMYYRSVGRNCNLLINANIDRDGLVPEPDMQRYREFGAELRRRFGQPIAETSGEGPELELDLGGAREVTDVVLMERIEAGERVREYVLDGQTSEGWRELARGAAIGHKRIERIEPVVLTKVRLRCPKSVGEPLIRRLAAY